MKFLTAILLLTLPLPALAQTAPMKPLQANNVEIIDGKKFFSLANARRQESTSLSPSALAVINNPRGDSRTSPANRLAMTPVTGSTTTPKIDTTLPWAKPDAPTMPPSNSAGLTGAAAQKADLLSIFAPDDHTAALSRTTK